MADLLAELLVKIGVDTAGLKKGLTEAEAEVKTSGTSMGATLTKAIPYMAIAAGVAMVGKKIGDMLADAAKYGQQISLAMEKTGLSSDYIQDLKYNADLAGVSFNTLTTAIGMMNTKLTDAAAGKDAAVKLFEDLGLSVEKLLTMNPDERIRAIFEALAKIPDESLRAGTAIKIFGTTGDDLLPLINKVDELKESLHLSAEEIESLSKGAVAMKELGLKWDILKTKFAGAIWPNLQPFLDGLSEAIGALGMILGFLNQLGSMAQNFNPLGIQVPSMGQILGIGQSSAPTVSNPSPTRWSTGSETMTSMDMYREAATGDYDYYNTGYFQEGGIVTSPTLAMIGEAGPEAVVPLGEMGGMGGSINIHIGNFLGDESALRSLARKIAAIQKEDERRITYSPANTEIYQVGGRV